MRTKGSISVPAIRANIEAIAGFLDTIDFTYFCTFTTRRPISLNSTRRIAEKLCAYVDAGGATTIFWAAEQFDVREGFHFHALMNTPYNHLDIWNWYFTRYGRAQIINNSDPDRRLAASYYVSKYITKELTDYDMKFARHWQNRQQLSIDFPFKKLSNSPEFAEKTLNPQNSLNLDHG